MKAGRAEISVIVVGLFLWLPVDTRLAAQEKDPVVETDGEKKPDQVDIERSLSDLLESLPELQTESGDDPAGTSNPSSKPSPGESEGSSLEQQPETDVIAELEAKILKLEEESKLSTSERASLSRLRMELRIAKMIRQQLRRAKPKKADRSDDDSFVIAQLEVLPQANVLDVRFQSFKGELESVRALWEYVCQTPKHGFRDFRIISRHAPEDDSYVALEQVRQDYDRAKKQQEQYLRYIAEQRAALARIAAARRC
jgi:hypothetical protein